MKREDNRGIRTDEKRKITWTKIYGKVTSIKIFYEEETNMFQIKFSREEINDYYTDVTIEYPKKNRPLPGRPFKYVEGQFFWVTNFRVRPRGVLGSMEKYFGGD